MSAGLTQKQLDDVQPRPGAQFVVWDTALPGFGVRVSPKARTFILKYRLRTGRVRWKTLGRVGTVALAKARDLAKRDIGLVADGKDPLAQTDASRDAVTVADAAERFLREHVEARRKPSTGRLYQLAINGHIKKRLGAIPIAEVSADDVVRLHHRLRATPILANRVHAVLSKLLAWSAQAKLRPAGPNPCQGIEKYPERKRKRYLSADEYARLGKALRTADISRIARTAIELLLLTGARPIEIASLEWTWVDLQRGVLDLPDSKTGAKTIHLPPTAVRILKKWPKWASSTHVFPGINRGTTAGHIDPSTLTHAWIEVRRLAQLDGVRLYDACRHSYASTAISHHGLTLAQLGEQLGHSQPATTSRYAHLVDTVAKTNATTVGGSIAAALKRKPR